MKKLVDFRDIDVTYTSRMNPVRNFTLSKIVEYWPFIALHSTDGKVCVLRMEKQPDSPEEYSMEAAVEIKGNRYVSPDEDALLTPYIALQLEIVDGAERKELDFQFKNQEERKQLESDLAIYNTVREMFKTEFGTYPEDLPKNSGDSVDKLKDKLFPALKSEAQPGYIPPLTKL